ncbi:hypothetical protein [Qipengyuania atrilutea]|uniref:Uncharacterized protein n=1 Tax=Qipengyuania atrilutea TaxID=2744473 RepID=A0A850H3Q1_9SPHN|nr:hypothetical protein [Actirhodobacter atriluteus]NVD45177.1 hypothetical protein [Actirhodobacter atriluteus]
MEDILLLAGLCLPRALRASAAFRSLEKHRVAACGEALNEYGLPEDWLNRSPLDGFHCNFVEKTCAEQPSAERL